MRLTSRIKSLERTALIGGGACCLSCGMPRRGVPARLTITAAGPGSFLHISEMRPDPPDPSCPLCGRQIVIRIPAPDRAREELGGAA